MFHHFIPSYGSAHINCTLYPVPHLSEICHPLLHSPKEAKIKNYQKVCGHGKIFVSLYQQLRMPSSLVFVYFLHSILFFTSTQRSLTCLDIVICHTKCCGTPSWACSPCSPTSSLARTWATYASRRAWSLTPVAWSISGSVVDVSCETTCAESL